jgi:hypothetical protein
MTQSNDNQEKLEQLIERTLRIQPARRAPQDLQAHVFAEIERGAGLPWWRSTFAHWPIAARAGFLVASYGFVRLVLVGALWVTSGLRSAQVAGTLDPAGHWLHEPVSLIAAAADVGASLIRVVPSYWLYGGVATALGLYVLLFGLGATAYRTLYIDHR